MQNARVNILGLMQTRCFALVVLKAKVFVMGILVALLSKKREGLMCWWESCRGLSSQDAPWTNFPVDSPELEPLFLG